jgi:hypothetical protein
MSPTGFVTRRNFCSSCAHTCDVTICVIAAQSHLLCRRVRFFCQSHLLMKLYVHVCCRRKTHFWITTCPASSRYLRTNDRDSAGYLLISVSTTLLIHFFSLLSCEHTQSMYIYVTAWPRGGQAKILPLDAVYLLDFRFFGLVKPY